MRFFLEFYLDFDVDINLNIDLDIDLDPDVLISMSTFHVEVDWRADPASPTIFFLKLKLQLKLKLMLIHVLTADTV